MLVVKYVWKFSTRAFLRVYMMLTRRSIPVMREGVSHLQHAFRIHNVPRCKRMTRLQPCVCGPGRWLRPWTVAAVALGGSFILWTVAAALDSEGCDPRRLRPLTATAAALGGGGCSLMWQLQPLDGDGCGPGRRRRL